MKPVYEKTFNSDFIAIWQNTPFLNEVPLLSLYRAMSCWLHNSDIGIEDRRRLVKNYLSAWFSTTKETDLLNRVDTNLSTDNLVINKIVTNIFSLYHKKPTRTFDGYSEREKDYLTSILESGFYDLRLNEAGILSWLVGESLIRPRQRKGKWEFEVIPRDMYRILYDENNEILEIWIPFQKKIGEKIENFFHIWTPVEYYQLDSYGQKVEFEYNQQKVTVVEHGYKDRESNPTVPFVIVKLNQNDDIYGGGQWELIRDQLNLCLIDYLIQENLVYGTTGFWFAKNLSAYTKDLTIQLSPSKLIHISTGSIDEPEPEIEHKSANFLASELLAIKKEYENQILRKYGIPSGMLSDNPNLPSGVAMLIDRIEIEEQREKLKPIFSKIENELINKIVSVNNAELPTKLPFTEVRIDFGEFSPYYEVDKEIEINDMLFERGLITPLEYVRRLTKNELITTEQEAIDFLLTNRGNYEQLRTTTSTSDRTDTNSISSEVTNSTSD
ncbi:MAG: hypothetical protein N2560_08785 [Ignavibacteria bacterium]|nr:hypothetical protein [Ignavibacteria bacterium]